MQGDGYLIKCRHGKFRCSGCRKATLQTFVRINARLQLPVGDDAIARLLIEHVTGIPVAYQLDAEGAARVRAGAPSAADMGGNRWWRPR